MNETLVKILSVAYASVGVVSLIAYYPTVKDLYYYEKPSANAISYIIWTVTSCITFLYSLFAIHDMLFMIVSGTNFLACALILSLRLRLEFIHKEERARATQLLRKAATILLDRGQNDLATTFLDEADNMEKDIKRSVTYRKSKYRKRKYT
jgi:hypothetical protein